MYEPAMPTMCHRSQPALRRFEAQLLEYWKADLDEPRSPRFATWATLRRGIEYENGYIGWLAWLAGMLERAP